MFTGFFCSRSLMYVLAVYYYWAPFYQVLLPWYFVLWLRDYATVTSRVKCVAVFAFFSYYASPGLTWLNWLSFCKFGILLRFVQRRECVYTVETCRLKLSVVYVLFIISVAELSHCCRVFSFVYVALSAACMWSVAVCRVPCSLLGC